MDEKITQMRLAEWMNCPEWQAYINPGAHPENVSLPDPLTNPDDCAAVETFLKKRGYDLLVEVLPDESQRIALVTDGGAKVVQFYLGDDYKAGVCELALKAIDDGA